MPFADIASEILQAPWKPACLYYSADDLAWQFAFPGDLPGPAAIAYLDDRPAGCVAATARRFAVAGETFPDRGDTHVIETGCALNLESI